MHWDLQASTVIGTENQTSRQLGPSEKVSTSPVLNYLKDFSGKTNLLGKLKFFKVMYILAKIC